MAKVTQPLGDVVSNTDRAVYPVPEQLTGKHVILHRLEESHIPSLYSSMGTHDEVWTYTSDEPFRNLDKFAEGTRQAMALSVITLYTTFCDGDGLGTVCFGPVDVDHRVTEIGAVLGPRMQRTRAATEAVYLLLRLAFDESNYRRVEWRCDSLNAASVRAAQRYGFVHEGRLQQHRIVKGRNRDTDCFAMLDSAWPVCKQALETWLADANFDEQGKQKRSLVEIRQSITAAK